MTRSRIPFNPQAVIDEPAVNLTPLIDVVFVILIMFIVVAPLLELERIELADGPHAPLTQSQSVQESSPIAIQVHADNSITFNNQVVPLSSLTDHLKQAKTRYPQATPQLFHDRRAQFGTYQSVKNASEEAGFSQLELILKPA